MLFLVPLFFLLMRYFPDQPLLWGANSVLAAIFLWMVIEDFLFQTVDLRVSLLLLGAAAYSVYVMGGGLREFLISALVGFLFSLFIFITGLYRPLKIASVCMEETGGGMQLGFLPSLAAAVGLWLLWLGDGYKRFWFSFMDFVMMEEICFAFIAFIAMILMIKLLVLAGCKWRDLRSGFGAGDVIVCTILSAFFGWKAFTGVFFLALWVHLLFCLFALLKEDRKMKKYWEGQ